MNVNEFKNQLNILKLSGEEEVYLTIRAVGKNNINLPFEQFYRSSYLKRPLLFLEADAFFSKDLFRENELKNSILEEENPSRYFLLCSHCDTKLDFTLSDEKVHSDKLLKIDPCPICSTGSNNINEIGALRRDINELKSKIDAGPSPSSVDASDIVDVIEEMCEMWKFLNTNGKNKEKDHDGTI